MSTVDAVEKRRRNIINIVYVAMILGLIYLFFKFAFSLFAPFIVAFFVAAVFQKPVNCIVRKTPLKKGLVSVTLVLLTVAAILTLLIFTGARIAEEVRGLVTWIGAKMDSLPDLLETIRIKLLHLVGYLPQSLAQTARDTINQFFNNTVYATTDATAEQPDIAVSKLFGGLMSRFDVSMLSKPVSGVWNTAKQIPSIAVGVVISIIASCFMTVSYDDIVNFIKRQFPPERRKSFSAAKGIFFSSILKMLKSYVIIIFITFAEMFIGLTLFKLIGIYNSEYIASVSIVVALVDILPVLGTGTVLVPWAIISFITGNIGMGIGLLVLYAVISVIRQIIEPKLVASNLGLPPIVTIMCMFIGLKLFGVLGMFVMPLMITMVKLMNDRGLLHVWKTAETAEAQSAEVTPESTEAEPAEEPNN